MCKHFTMVNLANELPNRKFITRWRVQEWVWSDRQAHLLLSRCCPSVPNLPSPCHTPQSHLNTEDPLAASSLSPLSPPMPHPLPGVGAYHPLESVPQPAEISGGHRGVRGGVCHEPGLQCHLLWGRPWDVGAAQETEHAQYDR